MALSKSTRLIFLTITLIFVGIISIGYFWYLDKQDLQTAPTNSFDTDISTWKTYRNEEYGFEFKYPPEMDGFSLKKVYDDKNRWTNLNYNLDTTGSSWPEKEWTAFSISVAPENVWEYQQTLNEPGPTEIDRKGGFVYGVHKGHDCPIYTDQLTSKYCHIYENVEKIASTFKFTK